MFGCAFSVSLPSLSPAPWQPVQLTSAFACVSWIATNWLATSSFASSLSGRPPFFFL